MKKPAFDIQLSKDEQASLEARLTKGELRHDDYDLILKLLKFVNTLRALAEARRFNVLKFLRLMFGMKTEKLNGSARKKIGKNPKSGNSARATKGRNGKSDYPGAKRVACAHESLSEGATCPECLKGKVTEIEPTPAYQWGGAPPLTLTIFLLQRFLCTSCKTSFTAELPSSASPKTVDDRSDEYKVARCDGNASANTMVAMLRYEYGVPGYRLAKIQGRLGLALPEGTQWRMIQQVKVSAEVVYEEIIRFAATGELFMNDDTRMSVSDVIKALKPPPGEPPKKRKKGERASTRTSTVIAKVADKTIVLYFTGTANAGENLARILEHRPEAMAPPIHMCDGLSANDPGSEYEREIGNCLTHARRGFFEQYNAGMNSLEYIIDLFASIYKVDALAKEEELSPAERLTLHQSKSLAAVKEIASWMQAQFDEKIVEPNSALGKHITYCQKRWDELTLFLRVEGAPLSNDENERANKPLACYRKNSLGYKTENGAETGDVLQSIIQICNQNGVSSNHYLTALQENRSKVLAAPEQWLPWNYTEQLAST